MRIVTLGISHEANTFSTVPADLRQWQEAGILHCPRIVDQFAAAEMIFIATPGVTSADLSSFTYTGRQADVPLRT